MRGPFVNNRINPAQFSKAAVAIASRFPQNSDPCGLVTVGPRTISNEHDFIGKVDYQHSDRQSLFVRSLIYKFKLPVPYSLTHNLLATDVTDTEQVDQAFAEIEEAHGPVEVLVSNAGITDDTLLMRMSEDQFTRVLDANLTAPYLSTLHLAEELARSGHGAVVNVGSQFALVGCLASPAYCASKAGLIGLTRAMAVDHASEGIRVNCVCPGPVDTPMLAGTSATPELTARERARTQHRNLVGRLGRPEDIAATIVFIMSDEAGSMTGSVVAVDGGWTAG